MQIVMADESFVDNLFNEDNVVSKPVFGTNGPQFVKKKESVNRSYLRLKPAMRDIQSSPSKSVETPISGGLP